LRFLLDVLLDMFLESELSPVEIRRERGVIHEEIAMYRDQPAEHVQDLLNAAQFGDHPLGRPVIDPQTCFGAARSQAVDDSNRLSTSRLFTQSTHTLKLARRAT
jgi:hypothetical protein